MAETTHNPSLPEGETIPDPPRTPEQPEGAGGPADYDPDPQGGGGAFPEPKERVAPTTGADAKVHGSRFVATRRDDRTAAFPTGLLPSQERGFLNAPFAYSPSRATRNPTMLP